jgi:hypothetical protein
MTSNYDALTNISVLAQNTARVYAGAIKYEVLDGLVDEAFDTNIDPATKRERLQSKLRALADRLDHMVWSIEAVGYAIQSAYDPDESVRIGARKTAAGGHFLFACTAHRASNEECPNDHRCDALEREQYFSHQKNKNTTT